jgi:uncharacterized protein YndB with AHSA1/START domain
MASQPSTWVSRIIRAPRQTIYQAFVNHDALVAWLPPAGLKGHVHAFDERMDGTYRMSLTYQEPRYTPRGKTSDHTDVVRGRFLALIPNERIVQQAEFESADPAFAGTMTITWSLADVPGGTEVTVLCENVPEGIREEDHRTGMTSTLENLATFTEGRAEGRFPGQRGFNLTGNANDLR